MNKNTPVFIVIFIVLGVLHQDFWNWDNKTLVFGFMPMGLAYHALYSVVAAGFWFCASRFAWPESIERWADQGPGE